MADLTLELVKASNSLHEVNAKLKDAREQLQRFNENVDREIELRSNSRAASRKVVPNEEVQGLQDEVDRLRKELAVTRETAALHEAQAATWRKRYEQLKPQLVDSMAQEVQKLENMRQELATAASRDTPTGQTMSQFRTLLLSLPPIAPSANPSVSTVVFGGTKLPLLSKASLNVCIGGVCFFGVFLRRSAEHAFTIFPEHQYNPKPKDDGPTWTAVDEWASLAGQQRELFYAKGGNICYAGTFLCHAGPQAVKVPDLGEDIGESAVQALAHKTLHITSKNPQSRQSKVKTYVPLLVDLYTEGAATVRILGLQRVGFNERLYAILSKAYEKRDRKTSGGTSASIEATPPHGSEPGKRKRNPAKEACDESDAEEVGYGVSGSSKIPRLFGGDEEDDGDMLF